MTLYSNETISNYFQFAAIDTGGWITMSNITALVEPNKRSLVVICHGLNMQLTENVVSTHTVNVLCKWTIAKHLNSFVLKYTNEKSTTDPPSAPIISGYSEGSIIPAGSVQKLLCISSGGNPLATLTWYKNDKRVSWILLCSLAMRPTVLFLSQLRGDFQNSICVAFVFR